MTELAVIEVEGELGVVFPNEILSRMGAVVGDEVILSETPHGYLLTSAKSCPEHGDAIVAP